MAAVFTVLICHGSYSTPELYEPLIAAFKDEGIDAHCPQLATSDPTRLNIGNISDHDFEQDPQQGGYPQGHDDEKIVTDALVSLIEEQGKRVLLLAHSAGGWVATQSATPRFQAQARRSKGLKGGIIGIVYMTAFIVPVGESIHSFFQPKDGNVVIPPWLTFHPCQLGTLKEPEKFFFHDLEPGEIADYVSKLTPSPVDTSVLTNDAYAVVPCAYLVCENDRMLPKEYQEAMAGASSPETCTFKIYRCGAGHAPHLSWANGVVKTCMEFSSQLPS